MKTLSALLLTACLLTPCLGASAQSAPPDEATLRQSLTAQPQNAQIPLQLANLLLERLRQDWARRDPNAPEADQLAQNAELERRAQELVSLYRKTISLQPASVEARVNLAEVQFIFLNQFEDAEALLQEALSEAPNSIPAVIAFAEFTYFVKGNGPQALDNLRKALQVHPQDPELSITLADLATSRSNKPGDFASARELLENALNQHPNHESLRYMLATVWVREAAIQPEQLDAAAAEKGLAIFLELFQSKPDADLALESAGVARSLGRLPQARFLVESALQRFPTDMRLRLLLGDLWLEQSAASLDSFTWSEELTTAESQYRQILATPSFRELISSQQVQLYYNLGLLAYIKGQSQISANPAQALTHLQESERHYRQAMAIFDRINMINGPLQQDLARTLETRGKLQHQQQQTAPAVEAMREACTLKLESSCQWLRNQGQGL
ncbi:MAG: tetratricopeptide repeat protein [Candidatus Sericytochromatia bacterium]